LAASCKFVTDSLSAAQAENARLLGIALEMDKCIAKHINSDKTRFTVLLATPSDTSSLEAIKKEVMKC
jgi:hypothetical protein